MSTDGRLCGDFLPGLDAEQRRQVMYFTIFPSMFLSPHPDYVLVHYLRPLATDRTEVRCQFLSHPDGKNDRDSFQRAITFWDQVNREDWSVCQATQRGVESEAYIPGPYSSLESMVMAFDRHYRATISDRLKR